VTLKFISDSIVKLAVGCGQPLRYSEEAFQLHVNATRDGSKEHHLTYFEFVLSHLGYWGSAYPGNGAASVAFETEGRSTVVTSDYARIALSEPLASEDRM
jgi:hypothetical protein